MGGSVVTKNKGIYAGNPAKYLRNLIMKFTDVNPFSKNEQSKINKSLLATVKGDFILGKM